MGLYGYKGITSNGSSVRGIKEADTPKELKALLKKEAIFLTEFWEMDKEAEGKKPLLSLFTTSWKREKRITHLDITTVTRQLATLLSAGVPLIDSLSAVIEQSDKPSLKAMLSGIRRSVNEGQSLATALGKYPKHFSSIYVNMVNAGEQSGTLELVLDRLADFMESQAKIKSKVISSMAYPVIMILIGIAILGILMTVVVPRVATIFEDFGQVLPWYTRMLIFISGVLKNYWWLLFPAIVGSIAGFISWKNSKKGKEKYHKIILTIPYMGELLLMLAMARFARTLSTLLSSGVQMLKSLEITKHILGNIVLERVIDEAIGSVREGESLHEPIQRSGKFPPIVTKMIAIGEKSGQLESMLQKVAEFYEARAEARITLLTSILEPVMILVMGVGAGGVAFSILWPILKIYQFAG